MAGVTKSVLVLLFGTVERLEVSAATFALAGGEDGAKLGDLGCAEQRTSRWGSRISSRAPFSARRRRILCLHTLVLQHESRPVGYMGRQPEIDPKNLVDWLVEVTHKFELTPESFYLSICRRCLVGSCSDAHHLQVQETWAPEVWPPKPFHLLVSVCEPTLNSEPHLLMCVLQVIDLIHIADNSYSGEQILVILVVRVAKAARSYNR